MKTIKMSFLFTVDMRGTLIFELFKIFSKKKIEIVPVDQCDILIFGPYDTYSINYITDDLNYKMVFIHDPNKFNDSIKNILKMFYLDVKKESELFSKDDILMYKKYILYLNN